MKLRSCSYLLAVLLVAFGIWQVVVLVGGPALTATAMNPDLER